MVGKDTKELVFTFLKGMGMGAADIVPGVSGGTIAFITGIYDKLLGSIASINFGLINKLKNEGLKSVWKEINGSFLVALLAGILFSVMALASFITYLMEFHPILIWSFFFGLVLASIFHVGKTVTEWNIKNIVGLVLGTLVAYFITTLPPLGQADSLVYIFFCAMIAICAMILPGISGSFILLILGAYQTVLAAIKNHDFLLLGIFALGCGIGLLTFSKGLKWMLDKYRNFTVAILTGFLVGSLNKIWPWKENLQLLYTHSDGRKVFFQQSILPQNYNGDPLISQAILWIMAGILVIVGMEVVAKKFKTN